MPLHKSLYYTSKKASILLVLLSIIINVYAQDQTKVYDYWTYYKDVSNSMYESLCDIAFTQLDARKDKVSQLKTKEDWISRQKEVREVLDIAFGTFPAKTPLNPVITGKIKKKEFTVEKLYFESRPNYYVTAALFLPTKGKGKKPAILFSSGHSAQGFRSVGYQHVLLNLVQKGFIVLAIDPIGQGERRQYFDKDEYIGPTIEHSYPGTLSFVSGWSPANYFIWDGIRAIDYLESRKEVDASRIGLAGRSGGGTQTAYLAAIDDRVVAAAPEVYITTFDKMLRSTGPQDVEQIPFYGIKNGFDIGDLIQVRAPKPTLMINTTRDIYFSIQGARDVYNESVNAYKAFDQSQNFIKVEDDTTHASTVKNREALYAFMQQYLNNPGSSEDLNVEIFDEKDLWVTPHGRLDGFLPSETLFSLNKKYSYGLLNKLDVERTHNASFVNSLPDKIAKTTGYSKSNLGSDYIFSGRTKQGNYQVEKYLIKSTGKYYVPVLRYIPEQKRDETVIYFNEQGKSQAVQSGSIGSLVENGFEVVVPDLTGVGELGGGYVGGDSRVKGVPLNLWYMGVLTGITPLAVRMQDIDALVDFVKTMNGNQQKIVGIASGTLSSDLLHAEATNKGFDRIALINPLYSYVSLVHERLYHPKFIMSSPVGVIGNYDIPDLVQAALPSKVLIVNPVNPLDASIDKLVFDSMYDAVLQQAKWNGSQNLLEVSFDADGASDTLINWLKNK